MINFVDGSIFDSDCTALVNPVNTVGVAGAGLAKQFAIRYPRANDAYVNLCKGGVLTIGTVGAYEDATGKTIVFFPTKDHWRNPSALEYIEAGITPLVNWIKKSGVDSIALPKLGCGLGGLRWRDVKLLLISELHEIPIRIDIHV